MKKKTLYLIVIAVVVLVCTIIYFKPLSLSDNIGENHQIKMVLSKFGIRNGEPYIDSVDYPTISIEKNSDVMSLFEKYTYRRTVGTLFSDGSMGGIGKNLLNIYVYDKDSYVGYISVSSEDRILVDDKKYSMKNAEQFIEQIIRIME